MALQSKEFAAAISKAFPGLNLVLVTIFRQADDGIHAEIMPAIAENPRQFTDAMITAAFEVVLAHKETFKIPHPNR